MCGIVGYSGIPKNGDRERFIELCRQSCIRGVHAFGIGYYDKNAITVFKSSTFEEVMDSIPATLPNKIVFHNRYSTSGDHREPINNQPIIINGNALVFNGTVDMGSKAEMEHRYGIRLLTSNDGELVLLDIEEGRGAFTHIDNDFATFAGIYLGYDGTMMAFRNRMRPLWLFQEPNCVFLCSTRDIASRAGFDMSLGQPVEPLTYIHL